MAEAFITEEAANFVTAHYEAKNRHLHNPKPRYNADDPKKGGSNLSLFKGNLAPASVSNPVSLDNERWRTISLYIFNNLTEVRPYIEYVSVLGTGVPRLACLRPTAWLCKRARTAHLHQQALKTLAGGASLTRRTTQDLLRSGLTRLPREEQRYQGGANLTRLS